MQTPIAANAMMVQTPCIENGVPKTTLVKISGVGRQKSQGHQTARRPDCALRSGIRRAAIRKEGPAKAVPRNQNVPRVGAATGGPRGTFSPGSRERRTAKKSGRAAGARAFDKMTTAVIP